MSQRYGTSWESPIGVHYAVGDASVSMPLPREGTHAENWYLTVCAELGLWGDPPDVASTVVFLCGVSRD